MSRRRVVLAGLALALAACAYAPTTGDRPAAPEAASGFADKPGWRASRHMAQSGGAPGAAPSTFVGVLIRRLAASGRARRARHRPSARTP